MLDKSVFRDGVNLKDEEEIFKTELKAAEVLNSFSNTVKNLGIQKYTDFYEVIENVKTSL